MMTKMRIITATIIVILLSAVFIIGPITDEFTLFDTTSNSGGDYTLVTKEINNNRLFAYYRDEPYIYQLIERFEDQSDIYYLQQYDFDYQLVQEVEFKRSNFRTDANPVMVSDNEKLVLIDQPISSYSRSFDQEGIPSIYQTSNIKIFSIANLELIDQMKIDITYPAIKSDIFLPNADFQLSVQIFDEYLIIPIAKEIIYNNSAEPPFYKVLAVLVYNTLDGTIQEIPIESFDDSSSSINLYYYQLKVEIIDQLISLSLIRNLENVYARLTFRIDINSLSSILLINQTLTDIECAPNHSCDVALNGNSRLLRSSTPLETLDENSLKHGTELSLYPESNKWNLEPPAPISLFKKFLVDGNFIVFGISQSTESDRVIPYIYRLTLDAETLTKINLQTDSYPPLIILTHLFWINSTTVEVILLGWKSDLVGYFQIQFFNNIATGNYLELIPIVSLLLLVLILGYLLVKRRKRQSQYKKSSSETYPEF